MLEILKLIYQKLCIFIQCSKKFYFFHFLVIVMLPATLLSFIALCCIPSDLYFDYKYDVWGYFELFDSFIWLAYIYCIYLLDSVIKPCILITIIIGVIKQLFVKTPFVTSKFLLNNKYYNLLYFFSMFLFFIYSILIFFTIPF